MTIRTCPIKTIAGNACLTAPKDDLPVCANHISHWVARDRRALTEFVKLRAMRIGEVRPAAVVADLLAEHGNTAACERILRVLALAG